MLRKTIALSALILTTGVVTALATRPATQEWPQPDAHHEMLLDGVGTWKGTLTTFAPGAPAEPIEATEIVQGVGPFWTQSHFECQFMGQPYVGTGCLGYDGAKGKFVGTWIDSMSTSLAVMEGDYDQASNTLTMHWMGPDMTGQQVAHRSETVRDENRYVSTFYMGAGDAAMKSMVIDMKRVLGKPLEAGSGR